MRHSPEQVVRQGTTTTPDVTEPAWVEITLNGDQHFARGFLEQDNRPLHAAAET